jgi:4-aminobutyrate aminotransferase-like enzyme
MISIREVQELLRANYGIEASRVTILDGYASLNFLIETVEEKYILKVYKKDLECVEVLEAETLVTERAAGSETSSFPHAIPNIKGQKVWQRDDGSIVRMLTFVEGTFLADAIETDELIDSYGEFLAALDKRLIGFDSNAISATKREWDLQHHKLSLPLLNYIPAPSGRSLVEYFFLQASEQVDPVSADLRRSVIHGDSHERNVLTDGKRVTGMIDFGDVTHTFLINELAIASAYLMCEKREPLTAVASLIKGYNRIIPLQENEIEVLYYLVALRLCISVCHSAESKKLNPGNAYLTESEEKSWRLLNKMLEINPVRAEDVFRKAAGFDSKLADTTVADTESRNRHTSTALSLTFSSPIKMQRAAFQYMYDSIGNAYLDCYNNIPQVGHCHPRVVSAGQRAMAQLNTNTRYLNDTFNRYAESLTNKFPDRLNKVFFVNSGSAASDLAIRLAMAHTSNGGVMAMEYGYHGNTRLGIDISHYKYNQKGGPGRKDGVVEAPIPYVYKRPETVDELINETVERAQTIDLAAFIAEPIVGCGGQVPLPDGYLKRIYPEIRRMGGVCISDEVQTGFGRLGEHFWGFELHGVDPDIVVLGKPMGNGHPIAAVVTTDEIAASFETGMEFFSSFGGNPVSCAIGQAVLDVLEEERLPQNAEIVGGHLLSRLEKMVEKFEVAGDARGVGLFLGLELVENKESKNPNTLLAEQMKDRLRERGILVGTDGPDVNVIKIKPPLCFTQENADRLADAIEDILEK